MAEIQIGPMDTTTGVISAAVGGGILYAVIKRKKPLGIFLCAMGFGLVGLIAGTFISKITT